MSGFTSPYEEDNPFADMQGSTRNVNNTNGTEEVHQKLAERAQAETTIEPVTEDRDKPIDRPATPPMNTVATTGRGSASRKSGGRKPARASAISSRLESLDLESDPLGPLGEPDTQETSPKLPPKGRQADLFAKHSDAVDTEPPATSKIEDARTSRSPSVPLQQAANPTFSISVGDPTKIGDITSAHTVYKVSTKTSSHAFKTPEFSVTRRYRDFLWLYDQLNRNCPGVIVPPAPEKQAVGRFSENFIEARRYALERMLEKISKHPILRGDQDFKLFLESESFSADIKLRPIDQKTAHESSKGFLGLGSFSMSSKFVETDEFFDHQKANFEALDHQLRQLSRAVDVVIRQRKDLASTTAEFGAALSALSTVELSRSLANALGSLSDLQDKIRELHERQAQQDLLTLGHTVEEYIRLITSVKAAFSARQKAWLNWQSAEAETAKRKSTGDKIRRQARTQQDRLSAVDQEMTEAERKSHRLKIEFDNIGKLLRAEIKRFDMDKVEDFKTSVEVFLESAVEAQKEIIEHWEFYSDLLIKEMADDTDVSSLQPQPAAASAAETGAQTIVPPPDAVSDETNLNSAQQQENIMEDTTIEPMTPTTPATVESSVAGSLPSPAVIIPPEEANPFA